MLAPSTSEALAKLVQPPPHAAAGFHSNIRANLMTAMEEIDQNGLLFLS